MKYREMADKVDIMYHAVLPTNHESATETGLGQAMVDAWFALQNQCSNKSGTLYTMGKFWNKAKYTGTNTWEQNYFVGYSMGYEFMRWYVETFLED